MNHGRKSRRQTRGGESSKWLVKQIKDLKIGLPAPKYPADDATPPKKVEPKILEDGTKVWPKVERRKVRALLSSLLSPSFAEVRDIVARRA